MRSTSPLSLLLFATAAMLLSTARSDAGFARSAPTTVYVRGATAEGALGATRNSSDPDRFIGCEIDSGEAGEGLVGRCSALGPDPYSPEHEVGGVGCTTTDPVHLESIGAIGAYSRIYFNSSFPQNGEDNCVTIAVTTGSEFAGAVR